MNTNQEESPSRNERVASFMQALQRMHDDPAEAARIRLIIDEDEPEADAHGRGDGQALVVHIRNEGRINFGALRQAAEPQPAPTEAEARYEFCSEPTKKWPVRLTAAGLDLIKTLTDREARQASRRQPAERNERAKSRGRDGNRHSSTVQVRVNERVLWVAGEAYPLSNISHVGQRNLEVNKGPAWKKFILRTLFCLFFGGFLAVSAGPVGVLILLAVETLLVWRLVTVLRKPPLCGLVLNSSGTLREAVWSTDSGEIQHLVHEITKAIGRPNIAQVTYDVRHAVRGDFMLQYGAACIGKAKRSGSGNTAT
ncbi:DUF6232 family protein [Streptomyces sp. NPDC046909]|uniref:DUF6232 family protein n=1 Tax=Streptomyces sp. NPDC046909 TaxID=3155617 RepID=UPI0033D68775